jgi:subtilase-type serine protease
VARLALDQLAGEVHASSASVLVDESLYARSAILGRLRQASYGGQAGMEALATGGPQAFTAGGSEAIETALAYGKSPIVRKAPLAPPRPTLRSPLGLKQPAASTHRKPTCISGGLR